MADYIVHQLEVGPLIGSGVLTYNTPVVSARTEAGQAAAPASIGSYSVYTDSIHPNTGKLIQGWKWDDKIWSRDELENTVMTIPSNWDPTISGVTENYFQSGIGSGRDLELKSVNEIPSSGLNNYNMYNIWCPEINHGYYYDYDEENYLYSDDSEIYNFQYNTRLGIGQGTAGSGFNYMDLTYRPKVGVPVTVRQYEWRESEGKYEIAKDLRKKVYFSGIKDSDGVMATTYSGTLDNIAWYQVDQTKEEFVLLSSGEDARIVLNNQYCEVAGSGIEFLGYHNGSDSLQFRTTYSPIDKTMPVEVFSYLTSDGGTTTWTAIPYSGVTVNPNYCNVDYDLGIIEFGDYTNDGRTIPAAGETITARYFKTVAAEFEPDYTGNTVIPIETNINPIYRRNSQGYIYLSKSVQDPRSIVLTAETSEISTDVYGPVYIGNSYVELVATVQDANQQGIEGESVLFFITSSIPIGSFGAEDSINSVSDSNGEARAYYNSPRTINDIGEEINYSNFASDATSVTLTTNTLSIDGGIEDVYLFQIRTDDLTLGYYRPEVGSTLSQDQIDDYYTTFLAEENISSLTGEMDADETIDWEDNRRLLWDMARPNIYEPGTGRKILMVRSTPASNFREPHTLTSGLNVFYPVQPSEISGQDLIFDTSGIDIPIPSPTGSNPTSPTSYVYSYFVVAPTSVKIKAGVFNTRLNQYIYSNEITLKIAIPSYANGIWTIESVNALSQSEINSLLTEAMEGSKVCLGFRIKSTNFSMASALNAVTFVDVNDKYKTDSSYYLSNPYYVDTLASGIQSSEGIQANIPMLGHKFEVTE